MSSKYCGTELVNQETNDEKIKKQMQISRENVPLNPKLDILKFYVSNGTKTQSWQNIVCFRLGVNYFEKVINYLQLHLKLFN